MNFLDFKISKEEIISTDKYLEACLANKIHYQKTDFLFQIGIWRGNLIMPSYNQNMSKIVTGHSDYEINEEYVRFFKEKIPSLQKWYGVNMVSVLPESQGLPLGVTNDCDDSPIHRIYGNNDMIMESLNTNREDKYLCYLNINIQTFPSERKYVYDLLSDKNFVHVQKDPIERQQFLMDIRNSKFCVCPRGNGIDTHRLWESLYLGTIPIVRRCSAMSYFYDLPILFIDDWNEISEEFLNQKYVEIMSKKWPMEKLTSSYWIKRILE